MTAATPVMTIRRRAKAGREAGFASLRAQGIGFVQALCGETWTDHNLHDPGITILEQLCYALTELVYRAEFPVADHLSGPDGRIDFDALSLHRPQDIFPCRATTAADYRRVLLDAVPGLDDATLAPASPTTAPANLDVPGVYRLMLKLSHDTTEAPALRVAQARAAYRAQRNLGEDIDDAVMLVRELPCELHAEIELAGPRDAADVLAEVYDSCARFIARAVRFRSLRERVAAGHTLEQAYEGPVMRHGFVDDGGDAAAAGTLYVADVAAQIRAIDGVKELRQVALQARGGRATTGSLPWRGEGWALRLRVPGGEGDTAPGHVVLRRRGNEIEVSAQALRAKLDALRAADRASRSRLREQRHEDAVATLPRGAYRPFAPFHSIQHQFPAVYGLGRHGVPRSAGPQAQARALQLKTYLLLFEQVMAHGAAQLHHLRELFSVNGGSPQSHWWQMIEADTLPGLEDIYRDTPAQIQREVYEPFDRSPWRKSRVLDHLLALYGETYSQNSMRQFCGHHTPEELDRLLLRNKAAYLRDIVVLGRDRASGFDDGKPSWNDPSNCSGLLRRVSLLLGFRHAHDRPLTQGLRQQRLVLAPAHGEGKAGDLIDAGEASAGRSAGRYNGALAAEQVREDLRALRGLRSPMNEAFFRAAVHPERYRLWHRGAEGAGPWRLALGPDERGRWWHLADMASEDAARRAAASLRQFVLALHHDSEGLHVVEHVLLRPVSGTGAPHAALRLPPGFFALRVTVVLPAWTARTHQPAFRRFAEETVRINAPLHLGVRCLWLDFGAMQGFEERYEAWLRRRMTHCQAQVPAAMELAALDDASCRVIEYLLDGADKEEGDDLALQGHA